MPTEVDILLVPKISDSTQLAGKSLTISDDTDGTPYRFSGDTINNAIQEIDDKVDRVDGYQLIATADVNRLANTSGENTGDQQASDFDIKDLTDSTDLRGTWSGKQDALGFTPENVANKSNDISIDANSTTKYPSVKAIKDYADGLVVGLLDDRGSFDASDSVWPSTGGSGIAGAIKKGDIWYISVEGTLGGVLAKVGYSIRALTDNPGQTASNWDMLNVGLGYVPENVINKKQTVTNSETDYPSGKAVYDELAALRHDQLRDPNGDPNYLHVTTGAQTFAGVKTFSSSPIIPIPTTDFQGAPKKYADDQDALKIDKTSIVNNLTETTSGKVLDARQGPILLDMLTKMNENWIGVVVDPSLSCSEPAPKSTVVAYRATELQRTGNLEFHKFGKSRIFNAFYPAIVVRATKEIAWRLDKSDFSKKENGTASTPDWTIHNICIVIPDLYRRIVLLDNTQDGRYEIRYDIAPFDGATLFHEESYHSISDAQMDRTLTQLVSVVSDDVRFRGGNNDATRDAQAWRTQLGMPATNLSRINFETYANNAGWETFNIYDHTLFSELAMLYFANTNIQLDYTSVLTAEGYPQGGLGAGNTTWISKRWSEKNGYYPLDKVGEGSMSIGCKVGVKSKTVTNYYIGSVTGVTAGKCVSTANFSAGNGWLTSYVGYTIRNLTTNATATITAKDDDNTLSLSNDIFTSIGQIFHIEGASFTYGVPVFFGLENIYGHLWKHCSGINIMIQSADAGGRSMAYVNPDWATRSGTEITSNYQYVGDIPRADGYIKTLYPGWNIPKLSTGAGSNSFMADYAYTSIPASGSSLRCLLVSAAALIGASAGLRYALSNYAPSNANSYFGARLRAKKPKNG